MSSEVDKLLEAWDAFIIPLRMREGYDESKLNALSGALHDCARVWREADHLPKIAVNVLVDIVPTVESIAYAYDDDPTAQHIRDAQAVLQEAIWECVAIKEQ
jgi:allophanate hydrolase subunit 1